MSNGTNLKVDVIELRMESLKANRNFFIVLFTIESAILGILIERLASLTVEFTLSVVLLSSSVFLVLLGIFSLTDSLHFYSKYLEYHYAWDDTVHREAYPHKDKASMETRAGRRALEADDVSYYCLKLSLLALMYFLVSLVLNIREIADFNWILFVSLILFVTFITVKVYAATHRKAFVEALSDFFWRKPVFKKRSHN